MSAVTTVYSGVSSRRAPWGQQAVPVSRDSGGLWGQPAYRSIRVSGEWRRFLDCTWLCWSEGRRGNGNLYELIFSRSYHSFSISGRIYSVISNDVKRGVFFFFKQMISFVEWFKSKISHRVALCTVTTGFIALSVVEIPVQRNAGHRGGKN